MVAISPSVRVMSSKRLRYEDAGLFSRLTYWWLNQVVFRKDKSCIPDEQVVLPDADHAEVNFQIFQQEWKIELQTAKYIELLCKNLT